MKKIAKIAYSLPLVGLLGLFMSSSAHAAVETVDFSSLTGALTATALLAGITSIAAVKFAPNIAKWGFAKLTSMFGSN